MKQLGTALSWKKGRKGRGDVFAGIASGIPHSPQIGFFGMTQPTECHSKRPFDHASSTGLS